MQQMMKQAQKMQQQIAAAQAELAEAELTGTAGGGLVTATVSGSGEIKAIKIDPKAVDPDDVETLEDLVRRGAAQRRRGGPGADRAEDGPGHRRHGRPRPARLLSRADVRGCHPGPDRRAGPAAGRRPEERPADRVPRPVGGPGRRQPAGRARCARSRSWCGSARPASTWPSPSSAGSAATRAAPTRCSAWSRSPRTWWRSSGPASSAAATTCSAGRSTRWRGSARTTCASGS